jgi:DNA topoisomerase IA
VSYGPCQTPTLNFTVERHQQIVSFQPEPYWLVKPAVSKVCICVWGAVLGVCVPLVCV